MSVSPQEVFRDVRRAYRLLHDYQRMVMDALNFISGQLEFDYHGGWNKFCGGAPRNGSGTLDRWAWDWLGLYLYDFHFTKKDDKQQILRLSALHIPDTAALEAGDKLDTSTFPPVEKSETKIAFVFGGAGVSWILDELLRDREARGLLAREGRLTKRFSDEGLKAHLVGVEELINEKAARRVVADLRAKFGLGENPSEALPALQ